MGWPLIAMAAVFLAAYAWPILDPGLPRGARAACGVAVFVVWLVFLVDYVVRLALAEARPGEDTVTRIATDFGFFELGRFAGIYTSAFGERPSDTLRSGASANMC